MHPSSSSSSSSRHPSSSSSSSSSVVPLPVRRRDVRPERGGSNVGVVPRWAVARRPRERVKHPREDREARLDESLHLSMTFGEDRRRAGEVSEALARRRPLVGFRVVVPQRLERPHHRESLDRVFRLRRRVPGRVTGIVAARALPELGFSVRLRFGEFAVGGGWMHPRGSGRVHRAAVDVTRRGRCDGRRHRRVRTLGRVSDARSAERKPPRQSSRAQKMARTRHPSGIKGSMPATIPAEPVWSPRTITGGVLETFPPSTSIERRVRCARAPRPDAQPGRPFAFAKMVGSVLAEIVFAVIDLYYP